MERKLSRRLLSSAIVASAVGGASSKTAIAQTCMTPCYSQTAAEVAAAVTPSNTAYVEGDIRRYGASTSGSQAANATAINNALKVSQFGGNAAFIPAGTWMYNSTLNANGMSSMQGAGNLSVLMPNGCNGITFPAAGQSSYAGSRFFRDFSLTGPSATSSSNSGIYLNVNANLKILGVQFSNLTIQNFAAAVSNVGQGGLWFSSFTDCFLYNNYQGYNFNGQTVGISIRSGIVQLASSGGMAGTGTRYAVYCGLNTSGNVQGLHMQGAATYGYDIALYLSYTVEACIENCDFSNWNTNGVYIYNSNGSPLVIRDCWIQSNTTATGIAAIYINDVGTAEYDKIIIDGNRLTGNATAGSIGIYCGENQFGVNITNNTIGTGVGSPQGSFAYGVSGISGAYSPNMVIKFNTIYALTTAIYVYSACPNADIGPNVFQNGTPLAFSTAGTASPGLQYVQPNIPMRGTAVFAATTTVAVTFANPMPVASYQVSLGGNAAGNVWVVNKSTAGFLIDCAASNSNPTDWSISL